MPVKINSTSKIKARLGIEPNGRAQKFFTAECARQMDRFVPFRKGILAGTVVNNGVVTSNVTTNTITYDQEYAKVVYYGVRNGKAINIHTDKHADATTYWDKRMWSAKGPDIIKAVEDFIKNGG